jgi:hypothetical protein
MHTVQTSVPRRQSSGLPQVALDLRRFAHGADVNFGGKLHKTLLLWPSQNGHSETVNADIARIEDGRTASQDVSPRRYCDAEQ